MSKTLALAIVLLLVFACAVTGLLASFHYEARHSLALQAQATLGQPLYTLDAIQILLATLTVLSVIALGGMAYSALQSLSDGKGSKWAPGPNARWKRQGETGTRPRTVRRCPGCSIAQRLFADEKPLRDVEDTVDDDTGDFLEESLLAWWQQK
jgi:hypothetical protein